MYARVRFSSTLLFRPFSDKIKILPQYAVLLLLSHIGRQHATVSAGRSTNSLKNSRVTLELSSPPLEVFHRVLSLFLSPLLSLSLSLQLHFRFTNETFSVNLEGPVGWFYRSFVSFLLPNDSVASDGNSPFLSIRKMGADVFITLIYLRESGETEWMEWIRKSGLSKVARAKWREVKAIHRYNYSHLQTSFTFVCPFAFFPFSSVLWTSFVVILVFSTLEVIALPLTIIESFNIQIKPVCPETGSKSCPKSCELF